ncbi:kinase-like domain-containing protein [Helicostylum pulchrum]|nr:kinase-like domain-containing protein [Helicostylum pulchrum]
MTDQKVACRQTPMNHTSTFKQEYESKSTEENSSDGTVYFTPDETESKQKRPGQFQVDKSADPHDSLRRKQSKIDAVKAEKAKTDVTEAITVPVPNTIVRRPRPPLTQEQIDFKPMEPEWAAHPDCFAYLQSMNPKYESMYLKKRKNAAEHRTGYLIGRGPECDICIEMTEISRNHCLIYMETGSNAVAKGIRIYLEDKSFNGTFVNGKAVGKNKRVLLRGGDNIQLFRRNLWAEDDFRHSFYRVRFPPAFSATACASQYNFNCELGKGNFATVYHAFVVGTENPVAIKVISKSRLDNRPKLLLSTIQEMSIMMSIEKHPFVVQIKEIYNELSQIYLVLEYVRDGELFNFIHEKNKLSENEARFIFWQLFLAIQYLHQCGIAHRDLKPENVLLADKRKLLIKVSDFGLAKNEDRKGTFDSQCGTPNYVAPEILNPAGSRAYDKQCDMWSLGVMLYICLCGFPPFSEENSPPSMKSQIKMGKFEFPSPYWDNISTEAKELVSALLTVDPYERATVDMALEMPWMKLNSEDFEKRKRGLDKEALESIARLNCREAIPDTQLATSQSLSLSFTHAL